MTTKIPDNVLREVCKSLRTLRPLDRTERTSDLLHIMSLDSSFAIFSLPRQGMTTLLKNYAQRKQGIWIECPLLLSRPGRETGYLEEMIQGITGPILLDEARILSDFLGNPNSVLDYLGTISNGRQLGLRYHNGCGDYREPLIQRGYTIVDIGKISYDKFRNIFSSRFGNRDISELDRFIQFGYHSYEELAKSVIYVAEAMSMMLDKKGTELTEIDVKTNIEMNYGMFQFPVK